MQTVGQHIQAKRIERGLSQRKVAQVAGISAQYLNDIEHGRRNPPAPVVMEKIANQLGLSRDYLSVLAGRIPSDLMTRDVNEDQARAAMAAVHRIFDGQEQPA